MSIITRGFVWRQNECELFEGAGFLAVSRLLHHKVRRKKRVYIFSTGKKWISMIRKFLRLIHTRRATNGDTQLNLEFAGSFIFCFLFASVVNICIRLYYFLLFRNYKLTALKKELSIRTKCRRQVSTLIDCIGSKWHMSERLHKWN